MCDAHLCGDSLACSLPAGHEFGHVYQSTSGIPDHHSLTSGE